MDEFAAVSDYDSYVNSIQDSLNRIFYKKPESSSPSPEEIFRRISSRRFRKKQPKERGSVLNKIASKVEEGEPLKILFPWGPGKNYYLKDVKKDWQKPDSAELMSLAVIYGMLSIIGYPYEAVFYTSGGRYNRVNRIAVGEEPDTEWEENYHKEFKRMAEKLIPNAVVHRLEDLHPSGFDIDEEVSRPEIQEKVAEFRKYATMLKNAKRHSKNPEESVKRFIAEMVAEKEAGVFDDYDIKIVHASHHLDAFHPNAFQYKTTPWGDDVQPWQGFGAYNGRGMVISKERFKKYGMPQMETINVKGIKVSIGVYNGN